MNWRCYKGNQKIKVAYYFILDNCRRDTDFWYLGDFTDLLDYLEQFDLNDFDETKKVLKYWAQDELEILGEALADEETRNSNCSLDFRNQRADLFLYLLTMVEDIRNVLDLDPLPAKLIFDAENLNRDYLKRAAERVLEIDHRNFALSSIVIEGLGIENDLPEGARNKYHQWWMDLS